MCVVLSDVEHILRNERRPTEVLSHYRCRWRCQTGAPRLSVWPSYQRNTADLPAVLHCGSLIFTADAALMGCLAFIGRKFGRCVSRVGHKLGGQVLNVSILTVAIIVSDISDLSRTLTSKLSITRWAEFGIKYLPHRMYDTS